MSTLGGLRPVWNRAMRLAERNLHSVRTISNSNKLVNISTRVYFKVIIEGAVGSVVHRDSLLKMLWQHIFEHTIQISARGTQFFRQHMVRLIFLSAFPVYRFNLFSFNVTSTTRELLKDPSCRPCCAISTTATWRQVFSHNISTQIVWW